MSRGPVEPIATTTASYRERSSSQEMSLPTSTPVRNRVPSASICSTRRSISRLFEFEVGDAVAHQAADRVVALVDDDGVSGAGQLLGAGESGRSGADDGHGHVGQAVRRHRFDVVQPATPGR